MSVRQTLGSIPGMLFRSVWFMCWLAPVVLRRRLSSNGNYILCRSRHDQLFYCSPGVRFSFTILALAVKYGSWQWWKKTISTDWTRVFFESSNQISQEGYGYSTESDGDPYAGKQITEKEKSRCESTTRYYNVFKKPRLRSIAWWFLGPKKTMEGPRKDR
jgi:hypothetical protein